MDFPYLEYPHQLTYHLADPAAALHPVCRRVRETEGTPVRTPSPRRTLCLLCAHYASQAGLQLVVGTPALVEG